MSDILVNSKKTSINQLKPELSYQKIKGSVGSITRKKESGIRRITKFCITCRNMDATNENYPTFPLNAYMSDFGKWIAIPYLLITHLKTVKYDQNEIAKLYHSIQNCLEKIYNSWSVVGLNPCKSKHMGKKITIPLKNGIGIICWVIVESTNNKIYLRLSYGGNKIECP